LLAAGGHEDLLGRGPNAARAKPARERLPQHGVPPGGRGIVETAIPAGQGIEERVERLDRIEARIGETHAEPDHVGPLRLGERDLHALDRPGRDALRPGQRRVAGVGRRSDHDGAPADVTSEDPAGLELLVGPGYRRSADA
jgi:hypothetical protein